ncbi:hypothetical protein Tco_0884705 [Tanacetum coccineum]
MRTRSQARKRRQQQVRQTSVESPNLEKPNNNQETFNPPIVTMDDNRTMAARGHPRRAFTRMRSQLFGHDNERPTLPHRFSKSSLLTMIVRRTSSFVVKILLFHFPLAGAAGFGFEKEPPQSILTCDDLVSKISLQILRLPLKQQNLRNESQEIVIQKFDLNVLRGWDDSNDLLRRIARIHGFSELHQLDNVLLFLNSMIMIHWKPDAIIALTPSVVHFSGL